MKLPDGFEIIKGYTKYAIDRNGEILSSYSGEWKPIYKKLRKDGYYDVNLDEGGIRKTLGISRLVANQFIGERPQGMQVAHNDGVRTNNRLSNLRYATPKENTGDKFKHGTAYRKVTDEDILEICRLGKLGWTDRAIAKHVGKISHPSIHNILAGKSFRHLPREKANKPRWKKVELGLRRLRKKKPRTHVYKKYVPREQRIDSNYKIVEAMHRKGRSNEEIGLVFGISSGEVAEIVAYLDGLGVTKS